MLLFIKMQTDKNIVTLPIYPYPLMQPLELLLPPKRIQIYDTTENSNIWHHIPSEPREESWKPSAVKREVTEATPSGSALFLLDRP